MIHRDIKPQNIFITSKGDYKLGDFGVARTMEKTMSGMSKKGTYNYMAPEVYHRVNTGLVSDQYSLGLVLYWLLNEKRMPFLPLPPRSSTVGSVKVTPPSSERPISKSPYSVEQDII